MGCGSSTVGVTDQEVQISKTNKGANDQLVKNGHASSVVEKKNAQNAQRERKKKTDPNANIDSVPSNNPVPKGVAFDIAFNDNLLLKNPPRRLQTLAPLNVPKLTPEMLAEKQRIAEEKREKVRQKRVSASRKSSRRRRELLKAKEFEEEQQQQQQSSQIDEQLKTAEIKRLARLEDIRNKQRLKQERVKRAREKAKRLNQDEPDVDLEVEKDDHYNHSDDSWSQGGDDQVAYFGSPKKAANQRVHQITSASTVDSFDQAFQRSPQDQSKSTNDDFFDS